MNIHAGVGAGKFRQPFRIREFLAGEGLSMAGVARTLGVHNTLVSLTVQGIKNNKKVLGHLHQLGCPEEFLSMPSGNDLKKNSHE